MSGLGLMIAFWRQVCIEGFMLARYHHATSSPANWLWAWPSCSSLPPSLHFLQELCLFPGAWVPVTTTWGRVELYNPRQQGDQCQSLLQNWGEGWPWVLPVVLQQWPLHWKSEDRGRGEGELCFVHLEGGQ